MEGGAQHMSECTSHLNQNFETLLYYIRPGTNQLMLKAVIARALRMTSSNDAMPITLLIFYTSHVQFST